MKKLIALLVLSLPELALAANWSLDLDVANRQVLGSGSVATEDTYKKVNLHGRFDSAWYINLWLGLDNDGFHEVDYGGGRVWSLSDNWSLDTSVNWWDVNKLWGNADGDVFASIVRLQYSRPDSSAYLYTTIESYLVHGDSDQNGSIVYAGVGGTLLQLSSFRVDVDVRSGYNGTYKANEFYTRIDIQPSYAIDEHTRVRVAGVSTWNAEGGKNETVINFVGLSHTF